MSRAARDLRRPPDGPRPSRSPTAALVVSAALLVLVGLLMTFSASFVREVLATGDPFGLLKRQAAFAALGTLGAVVAARTPAATLRRFAAPLLGVGLAASALVLVPGLGAEASGARRWLVLGPVTVQPSEVLKLALAVWLAHHLARRWPRLRDGDVRSLLMPALPATAVAAALVLAGPDLETAVLLVLISGAALLAAGLPVRLAVAGLGATTAVGLVAVVATPFRRQRVLAWLDPMAYPDSLGYQAVQGWLSLGEGGWFGVGPGEGRGQWMYIPNAHTDFIFAIIGEELGLAGALGVLGLLTVLGVAGVRTARAAADPFGRVLAFSVVTWLLAQAAMNVGGVVGVVPVTGVTLPLVSFGGTSLVITLVAVGLLVRVARDGMAARAGAGQQAVDRPPAGGPSTSGASG